MKGWLTPLVAFGAALAGVLVVFFAELVVLGRWIGTERVCGRAECGLGVGVWMIVSGFLIMVVALVAGVLVGVARPVDTPRVAVAVRRGLTVAAWCTLAYLLASVIIWWPKS